MNDLPTYVEVAPSRRVHHLGRRGMAVFATMTGVSCAAGWLIGGAYGATRYDEVHGSYFLGGTVVALAVGALVGLLIGRTVFRLTLDAWGVHYLSLGVPWDRVGQIQRGWWGFTREDVVLLHGGLRRRVPVSLFDPAWRTGDIGEDLRRWCPRLLA